MSNTYSDIYIYIYIIYCLGADPTLKGVRGETPLTIACKKGYVDAVKALLPAPAPAVANSNQDPNSMDKEDKKKKNKKKSFSLFGSKSKKTKI